MIVNRGPQFLENIKVCEAVLLNNAPEKNELIKLKICFGNMCVAIFVFCWVSYFALFFQVVVVLVLDPLGVDFELSSGPPSPS